MVLRTKEFHIIASPFRGGIETEVHIVDGKTTKYIKKLILEKVKSQYNFRNDTKKYRTQKEAMNDVKRFLP